MTSWMQGPTQPGVGRTSTHGDCWFWPFTAGGFGRFRPALCGRFAAAFARTQPHAGMPVARCEMKTENPAMANGRAMPCQTLQGGAAKPATARDLVYFFAGRSSSSSIAQ